MIRIRRGYWARAGTHIGAAYPCVCDPTRTCRTSTNDPHGHPAYWCRCWGRTDPSSRNPHCCGLRHAAGARSTPPATA